MAQYRTITVGSGHAVQTLTVRKSRMQPERAGMVRVEKSHRPPFDVPQSVWDAGAHARG